MKIMRKTVISNDSKMVSIISVITYSFTKIKIQINCNFKQNSNKWYNLKQCMKIIKPTTKKREYFHDKNNSILVIIIHSSALSQ